MEKKWINNMNYNINNQKMIPRLDQENLTRAECERLRMNYDFEHYFQGPIPPSKNGKYHKKNKNCREEIKQLVEETRKEKEVAKL